jgi:hypothetical protein
MLQATVARRILDPALAAVLHIDSRSRALRISILAIMLQAPVGFGVANGAAVTGG